MDKFEFKIKLDNLALQIITLHKSFDKPHNRWRKIITKGKRGHAAGTVDENAAN